MPKVAGYRLVWLAESGVYELQESQGERLLTLVSEDSAWFAWLAAIPSFTFRGQHGQLTVRKESRQRVAYGLLRVEIEELEVEHAGGLPPGLLRPASIEPLDL